MAASDVELRFSLRLLDAGSDRRRTMAVLRRLRPDLDLRQAKAMIDAVPCLVLTNLSMQDREAARRAFVGVAGSEVVPEWQGCPMPPHRI